MSKVMLFGNEVILDKRLIVTLTNDLLVWKLFKDVWENVSYAQTFEDLTKQINQNYPMIITPLTHFLIPEVMERGYDLFVVSGNKKICFSELLNGGDGSYHREIRETQNWEKMLFSGCFELDIPRLEVHNV